MTWFSFGAMASASFGSFWLARKQVTARLFDLPPATHKFSVKRDVTIRTADGEQLVHDHFRPKSTTPLPTILVRTPYGRSRTALAGFFKQILMQQYAKRGYHVILQDTRGRYASSGEFEPYVNEPDDGQTTINWIVRQPWSDGQIGMTGQSYVGFVSYAAAARDEHKHLKALFPIITQSRLGSLPEHAYPLDLALRWLFLLDAQSDDMPFAERMRRLIDVKYQNSILAKGFETLPLADTGQAIFSRNDPILDTWFSHPAEDDPYWDKLDHRAVVKDAPPAHFVAGWYDLFIEGQLEDYQVQVQAGKNPYLTIGAWTHLDPGNQSSTLGASLRWFDKHLKGIDNLRAKPVRMLLMGANEWREYEQWPPEATDTTYYLQGNGVKDGTLSRYSAPPNNPPSCYNYDPNNPTPNAGGPLLSVDAGPVDNRALEARKDVLTFTTPVLQSDCDVIGHPKVTLFVRSSAVSADFFGRICDVDPSGKSTNICDALYRIKPQRDQADANGGYKLTFDLSPIGYRFKAGHQIRLQISSGAFPRFQRNLGLDGDFMFETDMVVADQTVYHDPTQPSSVTLPIAASR